MAFHLIHLVLILSAISLALSNETYHHVIGCQPCILHHFPNVASLYQNTTKVACTGMIINALHILTSAACISQSEIRRGQFFVLAKSRIHLESFASYGVAFPKSVRMVRRGFRHPKYRRLEYDPYDVGLARLNRPLRKAFPPIRYAPSFDYSLCRTYLTLAWGAFKYEPEENDSSEVFHCAAFEKLDEAKCRKLYGNLSMQCMQPDKNFQAMCERKRWGGAIYCSGFLVGVSTSVGCKFAHQVAMFMELENYRRFIESTAHVKILFSLKWQQRARDDFSGVGGRAGVWSLVVGSWLSARFLI